MTLQKMNDGTNTYLFYKIDLSCDIVDEVAERMINNNQNKISSIAPVLFNRMNGVCDTMRFDITGKIPLSEYISYRMTQSKFRILILKIIESIEQLDDYMLELSQIYLNKDYIFINELNSEISFICIALQNRTRLNNLQKFFLDLITNMSVDVSVSEEDYFHRVWNIVQSGSFSLKNVQDALNRYNNKEKKPDVSTQDSISNELVKTITPKISVSEPRYIPEEKSDENTKSSGFLSKIKKIIKGSNLKSENKEENIGGLASILETKQPAPEPINHSFDELGTNILSSELRAPVSSVNTKRNGFFEAGFSQNETMLLEVPEMVNKNISECFLKSNSEIYHINTPSFKIGRKNAFSKEKIDLFIDSKQVSAYHAEIISDFTQNKFWIIDYSLNWTCVNDVVIRKNIKIPLANNSEINFCGNKFKFIIE